MFPLRIYITPALYLGKDELGGGVLKAFVLMNTELGQEASVVEALSHMEGVKKAYAVYGIYDVIAEIEADSMDDVRNIVFSRIRQLANVRSTVTLITYGESFVR